MTKKKIKNTPESCCTHMVKWLRNNIWISNSLYMRFREALMLSALEVLFQIDNMEYMPYIEVVV